MLPGEPGDVSGGGCIIEEWGGGELTAHYKERVDWNVCSQKNRVKESAETGVDRLIRNLRISCQG